MLVGCIFHSFLSLFRPATRPCKHAPAVTMVFPSGLRPTLFALCAVIVAGAQQRIKPIATINGLRDSVIHTLNLCQPAAAGARGGVILDMSCRCHHNATLQSQAYSSSAAAGPISAATERAGSVDDDHRRQRRSGSGRRARAKPSMPHAINWHPVTQ